jgi:penicillin-binding protein 1A
MGNDDSSPTKKATGGGMPVEIWARFMRTAHQNVAVAGLPGLFQPSPSLASMIRQAVNAPPPPHVTSSTGAQRPQQPSSGGGGIDGWLMDRLFGRR